MKFFSSSRPAKGNGAKAASFVPTLEWAAEQRHAMVAQQLRRRGIRDERVLQAMGEVPRHEYVPPEHRRTAYEDHPVSIGQGQTISQPYMVAAMTEALELRGTERVLEVGTGSGYQAAILARLAARVYTIERDMELFRLAGERLERLGLRLSSDDRDCDDRVSDDSDRDDSDGDDGDKGNAGDASVVLLHGDGSEGYPPASPYDGILVAAAAPKVPDCFLKQLAEGGRLVIPVGDLAQQEFRQVRKCQGKPVSRVLGHCRFVPLKGRHGWENA